MVYLLSIPVVLLVLTVHEVAHGYMAYRLGDPTAKIMGRLSLNPLKHLDPIGAICMVVFHFGWARPVPINTRYFKKPKRDMALTALAGPLSNFILAFFAVPLYLFLYRSTYALETGGASPFFVTFMSYVTVIFLLLHQISLGLGLFNLIPIPPLDGSRILFAFLPDRFYFSVMRYERYISFGLMALLFLGFRFGFLDTVLSLLSGGMERVWRLIPIFS